MKKIFYVFLILIFQSLILNAQTQFQYAISAINGFYHIISFIQTTDGGYAGVGHTDSCGAGSWDMYIIKLDANGTLQWTRTVGGPDYDEAWSITQTTDGGYAVVGTSHSYGVKSDIYFVKLDGNGSVQWSRAFVTTNGVYGNSIIQTTDGGYAVVGQTGDYFSGVDIYIAKLDANGILQWSKIASCTSFDYPSSIIQTSDGGYVVAGNTLFTGDINYMYIVKINASGILQWSRAIGGSGIDGDYAVSIIQTTDGGYAVAGYTWSWVTQDYDMHIVKLSSSGTLLWSKTIGGTDDEQAFSIIQTTDGGYVVAGYTNSFGAGLGDMYIVKLNSSGTLQWNKTVGGASYDGARYIKQTSDGGYVLVGWTGSFGVGQYGGIHIVKFDANGNTCGNTTSPTSVSGSGGTSYSPPSSTVTNQTSTVTTVTSLTDTCGTFTTITICVIGIKPISTEIPSSFSLSQNYPNPFNPLTNIKFELPKSNYVTLKIYDALGREIATLINEQLAPGTYEVDWNGSNYPSGVYFYRLMTDNFNETKKMLMIK